jgi:hypothetical protein
MTPFVQRFVDRHIELLPRLAPREMLRTVRRWLPFSDRRL